MRLKQNKILTVSDLSVNYYSTGSRIVDINFCISQGEVLGILGGSGSGKSTVCNSILGLIDARAAKLDGSINLLGNEILHISWDSRESINGKEIGVILQNPMAAFNPCMTIRRHFIETYCTHMFCSKRDAFLCGLEMLEKVWLKDSKYIMGCYPHELSGGMLQRIMIALAVSFNPSLIIADEPTTALDEGNQLRILDLLSFIMAEYNTAMLLVSHDFNVMDAMADRIAVMREGKILEYGDYNYIMKYPNNCYTQELIDANNILEGNICLA